MRTIVQRVFRSRRDWVAVVAGVAFTGMLPAVGLASPGFGVTSTLLVDRAGFEDVVHLNSDRIKLQTKDATDVRVQKLVFAPGSYSGWHHHPGIIIVVVESGEVTLTDSECNSVTYGPGLPAGAVFVEGGDEPIQASSAAGATNYVTYVAPDGEPFRLEDSPPPCAQ